MTWAPTWCQAPKLMLPISPKRSVPDIVSSLVCSLPSPRNAGDFFFFFWLLETWMIWGSLFQGRWCWPRELGLRRPGPALTPPLLPSQRHLLSGYPVYPGTCFGFLKPHRWKGLEVGGWRVRDNKWSLFSLLLEFHSVIFVWGRCEVNFANGHFLGKCVSSKSLRSKGIMVINHERNPRKSARSWGCSSVVERVLSMYEVPGSIPGTSTSFEGDVFVIKPLFLSSHPLKPGIFFHSVFYLYCLCGIQFLLRECCHYQECPSVF